MSRPSASKMLARLAACKASAVNYETRISWRTADLRAYHTAIRNGWLGECCGHMKRLHATWTSEALKASAIKYETRSEWESNEENAYAAARIKGLLEECCGHMTALNKSWNLEACKASALNYETRGAWHKGDGPAYSAAFRHGWLDECCGHMRKGLRKPSIWTVEACVASAAPYSTQLAWKNAHPGAYQAARRKGFLRECCRHMTATRRGARFAWLGEAGDPGREA